MPRGICTGRSSNKRHRHDRRAQTSEPANLQTPVRFLLLHPMTETGQLGALGQVAEITTADMYERLVVAALEIDIGGIAEAFIEDHRYTVGGSDGRDGTDFVVLKQRTGLILGGEP